MFLGVSETIVGSLGWVYIGEQGTQGYTGYLGIKGYTQSNRGMCT